MWPFWTRFLDAHDLVTESAADAGQKYALDSAVAGIVSIWQCCWVYALVEVLVGHSLTSVCRVFLLVVALWENSRLKRIGVSVKLFFFYLSQLF